MSTPANVHSLESIAAVRTALATFAEQVSDALIELDGEMRRVKDWLEHDRPRYWRNQYRVATDKVHEAQQALHRCLMFPIGTERPSCYEERAALKKAQARLAYCEEKAERVRHWQRSVQHELFEYEGRISQLVRLAEIEVPQAMAVLTKIIRRLEDYQSFRTGKPSAAYNELSLVQELWPEGEPQASASGDGSDGVRDGNNSAAKSEQSKDEIDAKM